MIDGGGATETFTQPVRHQRRAEHHRTPGKHSHSTELPRSLFNPTTTTMPEMPITHSTMTESMPVQEKPTMTSPVANEYKPTAEDQAATDALLKQIMAQAPQPEIKTENPEITDVTKINPVASEAVKTNLNINTEQIRNFVKSMGDRIKYIGKNIWYYINGSFIWDKGSKPTK